ncbi:MAG: thioredoxin domain-containing protein [Deltaproteobacteria bacterium]|nr:thioredoxin domain-containing protein [Deltaproteobacteria bacterium]
MPKGEFFANHLKNEKSPYLQQHAGNPVDWYPWSEEAIQKAIKEDKPVIISIGYASCHWCHVMERESFEDSETARVMNENFINIKVDREERPDLDSLYLKAVQAMTGHSGWPLTVFATPEGIPFYGGTYYPPDDRFGIPSFKKVLLAVSLAYKKNKKKIADITNDVEEALKQKVISPVELKADISDNAYDAARLFFDPVNGGFGRGTKFPHSMFLRFLLMYNDRTGHEDAANMMRKTLTAMASGGIYDHVGGGFHRYSVDERWDMPHFEKMLYDNALMAGLYAQAFEKTGIEFYKDTSINTLNYILRDLRDEKGGFYSSQDADVEGHEGAYYLWSYDEIKTILSDKDAERFIEYFSVTEDGNYEGKNMLRINMSAKDPATPVDADIKRMLGSLFEVRKLRRAPDTDKKIITAWNGLAVSALARAGKIFRKKEFIDEAIRCADFLLTSVKDESGRLLRYYLEGKTDVKGNLEDYALLAGGLLALFDVTGDDKWLDKAHRLTESFIDLFHDDATGFFFDTGEDQQKLFVRERDLFDNDVPSGNSAAADVLLRISRLMDNNRYREYSEEILRSVEGINDEPLSYGNFLCVFESFLSEKGEEKRIH